jgi:hypothetical protein
MGPFPHPSMSNSKYVLTFIDDWSRYTSVYFLKKKIEVFEYLKDFKSQRLASTLGSGEDFRGDYIVYSTLSSILFWGGCYTPKWHT